MGSQVPTNATQTSGIEAPRINNVSLQICFYLFFHHLNQSIQFIKAKMDIFIEKNNTQHIFVVSLTFLDTI
jgi:hypothetical protein